MLADPSKKNLLSAATKVVQLTPAIGVELEGIDLRQLTDEQKDELALLVAERGVVCALIYLSRNRNDIAHLSSLVLRNQEIDIYQQLELARHYGPLHKHATTGIPKNGLEEVHVVYNDSARKPETASFSKIELWHSDVSNALTTLVERS